MHSVALVLTLLVVLLLFLYWIGVFIVLYHLTRFGIGTQPKRYAMIFLIGSVIIFTGTMFVLSEVGPIYDILNTI